MVPINFVAQVPLKFIQDNVRVWTEDGFVDDNQLRKQNQAKDAELLHQLAQQRKNERREQKFHRLRKLNQQFLLQDFVSCNSNLEEVKSQISGFEEVPSLSSNTIKNQGLSQFDDALNNLLDEEEEDEEEEQEV